MSNVIDYTRYFEEITCHNQQERAIAEKYGEQITRYEDIEIAEFDRMPEGYHEMDLDDMVIDILLGLSDE